VKKVREKHKSVGTGSTRYNKGDTVTVYYDPATPDKPELNPAPKWIGWLIIGLSVLVLIGVWVWVYVTRMSKLAAATGGAMELVHIVTNR